MVFLTANVSKFSPFEKGCAITGTPFFMGEEKPDEELMGKRKPSPRLSTTSLDADIFMITRFAQNIHPYFQMQRDYGTMVTKLA
jgi:hypothetical protein